VFTAKESDHGNITAHDAVPNYYKNTAKI